MFILKITFEFTTQKIHIIMMININYCFKMKEENNLEEKEGLSPQLLI